MFNPEFYPSTAEVAAKMLEPYYVERERPYHQRVLNLHGKAIFDPSAGSGFLLDFVKEGLERDYYHRRGAELYCCEIEPDLKAMLQGKEYRLVADDFLQYEGDTIFDLILMNPPFSCADAHILKAFQVVGASGDVVALCNSETIRNPYTQTRKQLQRLIEDYGSVEELGQVFLQAERPTDVEVSLIRLRKPEADNPFSFQWENRGRESRASLDESLFQNQVATRDVIGNMITQFGQVKEQFVALLRAIDGLNFYGNGLTTSEYTSAWKIAKECLESGVSADGYAKRYNAFTEAMRQEIWGSIMEKLHIQKYLTNKVRANFTSFARAQGYMEITSENVWQLMSMVMENAGVIMEQAILDVFDEFTSYYKENRLHVEGWKTNSRYKVNRKLILPYWVRQCEHMGTFNVTRHAELTDVDKVCCYLTGRDYNQCYTITQALETRFRYLGKVGKGTFYNECESEFFKLRFFKKGTLHLEFRDERLWAEFNLRACAGKAWLPEPEMQAYRTRKRGPIDPTPAPEPAPTPAATPVRQLGPGQQLSLLDVFGAEPAALAA